MRPGQVVVDHPVAEVVEVDPLGTGVAGEEQADGTGLGAEVFDDPLLVHVRQGAVEALDHLVL